MQNTDSLFSVVSQGVHIVTKFDTVQQAQFAACSVRRNYALADRSVCAMTTHCAAVCKQSISCMIHVCAVLLCR